MRRARVSHPKSSPRGAEESQPSLAARRGQLQEVAGAPAMSGGDTVTKQLLAHEPQRDDRQCSGSVPSRCQELGRVHTRRTLT